VKIVTSFQSNGKEHLPGFCEFGDETLYAIKHEHFNRLRKCQMLK